MLIMFSIENNSGIIGEFFAIGGVARGVVGVE